MHIAVGIYHPAHLHFYRNLIKEMEKRGHLVTTFLREKDVIVKLAKEYNLNYVNLGSHSSSLFGKIRNWIHINRIIKDYFKDKEKPDVVTGIADMYLGLYAFLNRIPSVFFSDDDILTINTILSAVLGENLITPANCKINYSKYKIVNHTKYDGFHELSYLHPKNYKPDNSFFEDLGISKKNDYVVIRLVSWEAAHDLNKSGIQKENLEDLISQIMEKGITVYISSEKELSERFKKYQLNINPRYMHDLLYHSNLLISDSQTMSTEAALLGTPVVRSNSFVGKNDISNFVELQNKYGLIFNLKRFSNIVKVTNFILDNSEGIKEIWNKRREKMLKEKIDVNEYLISFFSKLESKTER